jgi:alpha-beta hydrolase superfamily lysophospholipase
VARGIAVVAQDHRGHGWSGGARQRFDSMEQIGGDIGVAIDQARQREPGLPVFLFGHSMGGLGSLHYAIDHPAGLSGLILSGPAIALAPDAGWSDRLAVRFFGAVWPSLPLYPVDDTTFVRTAQAKRELAADPLIDPAKLPAASARAFLTGIEGLDGQRVRLKLPLLILHGAMDPAAPIEGSRRLISECSSTDKTLREVPGAAHDLWHEPEAMDLEEFTAQWVVQRL